MVSESYGYLWDGKRSQQEDSVPKSTLTEQLLLPGLGGHTVPRSVNFWITLDQRRLSLCEGLKRGAKLQLSCGQSCVQAFKQMLGVSHRLRFQQQQKHGTCGSRSRQDPVQATSPRGYQEWMEVQPAGDGSNFFFSKGFCPEDLFSAVKDVDTCLF